MNKPINYIWIKINTKDSYKLFIKLNNVDINFYDAKVLKDWVLLQIKEEDYIKITKNLISYKVKRLKNTGIYRIKDILEGKKYFVISFIIGLFLLMIANKMIFNIEIISNDKHITKLVKSSLDKYNLKLLTFKKNHFTIEKIVEKILDENKDYIEWLEISYDGMKMIVEVTKKVDEKITENDKVCNIVAKSDAKILNYIIKKGESIVNINQYVYKDDVLITGVIKYNEEIKNMLCADAIVYGELWYKVNVVVPYNNEEYVETGKSNYNFIVNINDKKYKILKSRFKKYNESKESLYKLKDFKIELSKEKEVKLKTIKLTEAEALKKGIKLAEEKVKLKLQENEEILEKKVLKKVLNDSTIELDIFIVTKENIARKELVKEVDINDKVSNKYSNE